MKITVLGKGTVGKSSLTYKYINYSNQKDYDPTIEDKYSTVVTMNGMNCEVEILDTAGQDDYQSLINYWINFGEGFILVYSINDKESFKSLDEKREIILKLKKNNNVPMVIVGNKSDLENERKISREEGQSLAKKWGCKFFETSVLADKNCKDPFNNLVSQILGRKSNDNNHKSKNAKKSCSQRCVIF